MLTYFSYLIKCHLARRKGKQKIGIITNLIQSDLIWIGHLLQCYNNVFSNLFNWSVWTCCVLCESLTVCTAGSWSVLLESWKKWATLFVKEHSSVWRKRGLRDMGMEGGFTSRVADFDVTDTSQLQLLNPVDLPTVKKVLWTEKMPDFITDRYTNDVFLPSWRKAIVFYLSYGEPTQIIASFFVLKVKRDKSGFWDWFQSLVWPEVIQHTFNFSL